MPFRNLVLLLAACATCLAAWAVRERGARGRRIAEVLSHIERSYLDAVDADAVCDAAIDAAVAELDEHSAVLRDEGRRDLEAMLDQHFGGVGLELAIDERTKLPVVLTPVPGSPAWRAGIQSGDRIDAIDGRSVAGLPLTDTVGRLRGRPGSTVVLTVASGTANGTLDPAVSPQLRDVDLVRDVVRVESVLGDRRLEDGSWEWLVEGAADVVLLRVTHFGERTADELASALEGIEAARAGRALAGIVLDLRGNAGGLMSAAVEVCDQFLDAGVIVSTRGRAAAQAAGPVVRRAREGAAARGVPMAVLVDGITASAAEIVAACLQDHGRAKVVGSRTYGKGTVQSILPLSDGRSLLKLTTAEYVRPSEAGIHRRPGDTDSATWGVMPDGGCEVAPTAAALERLRVWRRGRDVPPRGTVGIPAAAPAEVDPVLRAALTLFRPLPSGEADLGGEEEASRDTDETAPRGQ